MMKMEINTNHMSEINEIKTVDNAVDYLIPMFEGMDNYFNMSEDDFAAFCHSQLSGGIGMQIRNMFGFWTQDTPLYEHMKSLGIEHPDGMSDLLIRNVYKKVNK